jgi:hypothetical protein
LAKVNKEATSYSIAPNPLGVLLASPASSDSVGTNGDFTLSSVRVLCDFSGWFQLASELGGRQAAEG